MDVNMTISKSFKWFSFKLAFGQAVDAVIVDNIECVCIGVHEFYRAIFFMGGWVHMHVCWRLVIDFAYFLSDLVHRLKHSSRERSDLSLRKMSLFSLRWSWLIDAIIFNSIFKANIYEKFYVQLYKEDLFMSFVLVLYKIE